MRLLIAVDTYFYKCIDSGAAPHWGYVELFQRIVKNTCRR